MWSIFSSRCLTAANDDEQVFFFYWVLFETPCVRRLTFSNISPTHLLAVHWSSKYMRTKFTRICQQRHIDKCHKFQRTYLESMINTFIFIFSLTNLVEIGEREKKKTENSFSDLQKCRSWSILSYVFSILLSFIYFSPSSSSSSFVMPVVIDMIARFSRLFFSLLPWR